MFLCHLGAVGLVGSISEDKLNHDHGNEELMQQI